MNKVKKQNQRFYRLEEIIKQIKEDFTDYKIESDEVSFFNLFLREHENNKNLSIIKGCDVLTYKYIFEEENSVLLVFSIPNLNENNKTETRSTNEKILGIIKLLEDYFTYLDFVSLKSEGTNEQYSYLVVIKKLKRIEEK